MTDWNLSVVVIVPAALREKANLLTCALGYDVPPGNTFVVPLSSDGENITHYGCRTSAKQEFVDIMNAAAAGLLPPDFPFSPEDVEEVVSAQIMDVRDASEMLTHFDDVLTENGLTQHGV